MGTTTGTGSGVVGGAACGGAGVGSVSTVGGAAARALRGAGEAGAAASAGETRLAIARTLAIAVNICFFITVLRQGPER